MRRTYANGALYCVLEEESRTYFYEDGKLKTAEKYLGGRLHDEVHLYWENGNLKRCCSFEKGIRNGLDRMWSEEGQLLDEGSYLQGKPVGAHRRYSQKGQLLEEIIHLTSGRFNIQSWDETGTLRVDARWIDETNYEERVWDRFQNSWIEKRGRFDGKKLVYI